MYKICNQCRWCKLTKSDNLPVEVIFLLLDLDTQIHLFRNFLFYQQ